MHSIVYHGDYSLDSLGSLWGADSCGPGSAEAISDAELERMMLGLAELHDAASFLGLRLVARACAVLMRMQQGAHIVGLSQAERAALMQPMLLHMCVAEREV